MMSQRVQEKSTPDITETKAPSRQQGESPETKATHVSNQAQLPLAVVEQVAGRDQPPKATRHWMRWGVVFVCLVASGVVAFLFRETIQDRFRGREATAQPVPVDQRSVFALGRLEPEGEVISVAAPSSAGESRVDQLNVRENDEVKQGDVLAVLDNEDRLKAAVEVAVKTAEQARVQIERTQLEVETTRSQLEAALKSSQSRLANAEIQLKRIQGLYKANASTQDEYERRELDVTTSKDMVREAQSKLNRYIASPEQELVDVTLSRQELATAQAQLLQARANLEQAYVHAPMDGTILRIHVRRGERIGQSPLLEMGATRHMMARVDVYESDIAQVEVGEPVRLSASPLSQPLAGTVDRKTTLVRQQEIVNAIPAANTDARVVEVWVRLDAESSEVAAKYVNLQVRAEFLP